MADGDGFGPINGTWKMSRTSALIFAIIGLGGGFTIYDQRTDVATLKVQVAALKEGIALGNTWRDARFDRSIADIKASLHRIEAKLDRKADKP